MAFSPLLFLLLVIRGRYTCMKRTLVSISSLVACIHMTFTLVPHKVYFTIMDFMLSYGVPHKIYFTCMASTSNYGQCRTRTSATDPRPTRALRPILVSATSDPHQRSTHINDRTMRSLPYFFFCMLPLVDTFAWKKLQFASLVQLHASTWPLL